MNTTKFVLEKELSFNTVNSVLAGIKKILNQKKLQIICLDLNKVQKCDSAGLALLIEASRLCRQNNKHLYFDGVSGSINSLAEFCGVKELLSSNKI